MKKVILPLVTVILLPAGGEAQTVQFQGDWLQIQAPTPPTPPEIPPPTESPARRGAAPAVTGNHVRVGTGNSGAVTTGIGAGAQIQGITIINGEVYIDGEKVPAEAKRFTARSGKTYVIDRSGGTVSVHDE